MLPKTNNLKGLGHISNVTRTSTLALTLFSNPSAIKAMSKGIADSLNLNVRERIIQGSLLSNSYFKGSQIPELTKSLTRIAANEKLFSFGLQSGIIKATELNLFAEKKLSGLNWNTLGSRIGMDDDKKSLIQKTLFRFSKDYSKLFKDV